MSRPLAEKMLALPEFEAADFKQYDNDMGFYAVSGLPGLRLLYAESGSL